MQDAVELSKYHSNLKGVREASTALLDSFKKYDIHATWAVVGFLFLKDKNEFQKQIPTETPSYSNTKISPYKYFQDESESIEDTLHFAPDIIEKILEQKHQEVATHTYSHLYSLEKGITASEFSYDLEMAIKIAHDKFNLHTHSLVFPRNQWNRDYLHILSDLGISSYRGNAKSWIYSRTSSKKDSKFKKLIRLIDSYVNLTGYHTHSLSEISQKQPFNIPASRFLRPFSKKLQFLDELKLKRIKDAMTYAVKNGELFHLWWHPHNFGVNLQENIIFLEKILSHYHHLETTYGMKSYSMQEISKKLQK